MLGPFVPLCTGARQDRDRARSTRILDRTASRPSSSAGSPSATRACWRSRRCWACCAAHTEEDVNEVNAPAMAEERGIDDRRDAKQQQRARLHRPGPRRRSRCGDEHGPRRRHADRPPRPPAPARGLGPALRRSSSRTTSRCSATATVPGMIGRVGTLLRRHTASTSSPRPSAGSRRGQPTTSRLAAMVITTDAAVPDARCDEIVDQRRVRRRRDRHALTIACGRGGQQPARRQPCDGTSSVASLLAAMALAPRPSTSSPPPPGGIARRRPHVAANQHREEAGTRAKGVD